MFRLMIYAVAVLGVSSCASNGTIVSKENGMESRRVSVIRSGDVDPADNDRICKSIPITGSRVMRRACHTRAEWAAMRRNAEDTVRTTQQGPTFHFENLGIRNSDIDAGRGNRGD